MCLVYHEFQSNENFTYKSFATIYNNWICDIEFISFHSVDQTKTLSMHWIEHPFSIGIISIARLPKLENDPNAINILACIDFLRSFGI